MARVELAGESGDGDGDGNGAQRVASADLGDDTFSDGSEVALGTDPNDPDSFSRQPLHSLAPGGLLLLGIALVVSASIGRSGRRIQLRVRIESRRCIRRRTRHCAKLAWPHDWPDAVGVASEKARLEKT